MSIRVGINGLGRIGRNAFRAAVRQPDLEVVAANDITDVATLAYLLRYDSILGTYPEAVNVDGESLVVGERRIRVFGEKEPGKIPWGDLKVDVVLDCTGKFTDATKARAHIDPGGARKVIISAGATNEDMTIVLGVNESRYEPDRHHVISNASCTTNCLVPVVKVLHDRFGVESGVMTTVHAFTNSQRLLDAPHKDLRRARAATLSIIPTTSGAVRSLAKVIPELAGRFQGMALRVPVPSVSIVDLTVVTKAAVTAEAINSAFRAAAAGPLKEILAVADAPLVSVDFEGNPHSAIVDASSTMVAGDKQAKVLAWYDNEWGYASRLVDLAAYVGRRLAVDGLAEPAPKQARSAQ
ncbi:type I glyceraldehyde-3-phosphate dehydrogenase [bacterium]|nr:MAG: type I glyceraldehyde-3-phosphate dehydrogenase [bacterium]